jgi:hypothetical protein
MGGRLVEAYQCGRGDQGRERNQSNPYPSASLSSPRLLKQAKQPPWAPRYSIHQVRH